MGLVFCIGLGTLPLEQVVWSQTFFKKFDLTPISGEYLPVGERAFIGKTWPIPFLWETLAFLRLGCLNCEEISEDISDPVRLVWRRISLITIGTWNLDWAFASSPQQYSEVLNAQRADLWVLTETRDLVCPAVHQNAVHSPQRPRDDVRKWTQDSRWVSIWSRWPLEQIPTEADPTRVVCARVSPSEMQPFLIYGTVLPWNGDRLYRKQDKRRAIERQVEEWRSLIKEHRDCFLIVIGDYNQGMSQQKSLPSETLQGAIELGLQELNMTCLTSPQRVGHLWPHQMIDHISVPNEIAAEFCFETAWLADPKLSDHGGIVVSLRLS